VLGQGQQLVAADGGDRQASVAPYGVNTCAPSGSIASVRRCTRAGTGAPAEITRRTVGMRRSLRLSVSSSPGLPNMTVAPKRSAAATTRDGTTAAGRVASIAARRWSSERRAVERERREGRQHHLVGPMP
jgi:hypothetical protein